MASAPHDDSLVFYIKAKGPWTNAIHDSVINGTFDQLQFCASGPFGAPSEHMYQYDRVIFVAGGIGVTPFISVFKDIHTTRARQPSVSLAYPTLPPPRESDARPPSLSDDIHPLYPSQPHGHSPTPVAPRVQKNFPRPSPPLGGGLNRGSVTTPRPTTSIESRYSHESAPSTGSSYYRGSDFHSDFHGRLTGGRRSSMFVQAGTKAVVIDIGTDTEPTRPSGLKLLLLRVHALLYTVTLNLLMANLIAVSLVLHFWQRIFYFDDLIAAGWNPARFTGTLREMHYIELCIMLSMSLLLFISGVCEVLVTGRALYKPSILGCIEKVLIWGVIFASIGLHAYWKTKPGLETDPLVADIAINLLYLIFAVGMFVRVASLFGAELSMNPSAVSDPARLCRVHLIWAVPELDGFSRSMVRELGAVSEMGRRSVNNGLFDLQVFKTRGTQDESGWPLMRPLRHGRPDWTALFEAIINEERDAQGYLGETRTIGVFFCGSPAMANAVRTASTAASLSTMTVFENDGIARPAVRIVFNKENF
eukprot:CAMPEP_0114546404 /NCGR_PEP_ID=MMETSP0114-20121206/3917_1 /TAXON_ID=31324 /ORGANISM="Goniomonas sp, Strain m" /LENGTH=532 /DNA_ID=CAMNT_0001730899 /DNA_START=834 /DNA_END=2432 /DNA_ORIENTATION=+